MTVRTQMHGARINETAVFEKCSGAVAVYEDYSANLNMESERAYSTRHQLVNVPQWSISPSRVNWRICNSN